MTSTDHFAQPIARKDSKTLAFIGLGVMGAPMAIHLIRAGYTVRAFNRTLSKAEHWLAEVNAEHASIWPTPAAAAAGADMVISCVGADADLRAVVLGPDGALPQLKPGAIWVDHSTTSAEIAVELATLAAQQSSHFLDAPVSGGNVGAVQGTLTIMCGGALAAFEQIEPIVRSYARAVTLVGPVGTGQRAKMVNQICVAGVLQGLAEALAFGEKAGLDMLLVLDIIRQGAAQSWQMEQRGPTMLQDQFDFGFAVDWMRKDLGLCLQEARRLNARLPTTALIDQFYAALQAQAGGRWDTSSLIRLLR